MRWEEIKTKEQLNAKFCFLAPKHNYINSARYHFMVLIKSFCQAILVGEKAWKPFSLRGTWDLTTGGGGCSCYCRGTSGGSKWGRGLVSWDYWAVKEVLIKTARGGYRMGRLTTVYSETGCPTRLWTAGTLSASGNQDKENCVRFMPFNP